MCNGNTGVDTRAKPTNDKLARAIGTDGLGSLDNIVVFEVNCIYCIVFQSGQAYCALAATARSRMSVCIGVNTGYIIHNNDIGVRQRYTIVYCGSNYVVS